jgi:hypothetical protein
VLSIITAEDPVWRMEQLLHNFPAHAASLSAIKVNADVKQVFSEIYTSGLSGILPVNSVLINGSPFDLNSPTFCLYDFLDAIKREHRSLSEIRNTGFSSAVTSKLISTAQSITASIRQQQPASSNHGPPKMESIVRVDVSKGGKNVVQFINNLEKDAIYVSGGYSSSVMTLAQPSWSLHMIAKNLYTVVAIVNPFSLDGCHLVQTIQQVFESRYPIRLGLVIASRKADDKAVLSEGTADRPANPSDFLRIFEFIKSSQKLKGAMDFLFAAVEMVQQLHEERYSQADVTVDGNAESTNPLISSVKFVQWTAKYLASQRISKKSGTDLIKELTDAIVASDASSSSSADIVRETREFLEQRGLPDNSFSFNGIVSTSSDLQGELMSLLGREQYFLAEMVRSGTLTDRTRSIFNLILKHSRLFARYHPVLTETDVSYVSPRDSRVRNLITEAAYVQSPTAAAAPAQGPCTPETPLPIHAAPNTILVMFPLTRSGLESVSAAVAWVTKRHTEAAGDAHRLALIPMLRASFEKAKITSKGRSELSSDDELLIAGCIKALSEVYSDSNGDVSSSTRILSAISDVVNAAMENSHIEGQLWEKLSTNQLEEVWKQVESSLESASASAVKISDSAVEIIRQLSSRGASVSKTDISNPYASTSSLSDCESCDQRIVILFNGRVTQTTSLNALDLDVIADVESNRVTASLRNMISEHTVWRRDLPDEFSRTGLACDNAGASALFVMSSFVGDFSNNNPNKVNVKGN